MSVEWRQEGSIVWNYGAVDD